MPEPIRISPLVVVPASAVGVRAVRASGPGGQNVNKVASKVELRIDLSRVRGLTSEQRDRLETIAEPRKGADGLLVVTSQRTRDQSRNLEDAREKVRELVARALVRPRPRRATAPTAASRQQRRRRKAILSERKRARGAVRPED